MKKVTKILALVLATLLLVCSLTACSKKLNGTYSNGDVVKSSFTFNGDKVDFTAFGITASGTYKIDGDEITLTYSVLGVSTSVTKSFEKKGKTIIIDGAEYTKE